MIITDQKQSQTDAVGQGRTPVLVDMNADCRSIIVNAPVAEVYRRCLEFEKLPEFITFDQENRENQSDQLLVLVGDKGRRAHH